MWLFTESGFVSVVEFYGDASKVAVRSRDRRSLEEFKERSGSDAEVLESAKTDYRFRVIVDRPTLLAFLETTVDRLDYTNFKNRADKVRGPKWHAVLSTIWGRAHGFADPEPYARPQQATRGLQCLGMTHRGRRCRNEVQGLLPFCSVHEDQDRAEPRLSHGLL